MKIFKQFKYITIVEDSKYDNLSKKEYFSKQMLLPLFLLIVIIYFFKPSVFNYIFIIISFFFYIIIWFFLVSFSQPHMFDYLPRITLDPFKNCISIPLSKYTSKKIPFNQIEKFLFFQFKETSKNKNKEFDRNPNIMIQTKNNRIYLVLQIKRDFDKNKIKQELDKFHISYEDKKYSDLLNLKEYKIYFPHLNEGLEPKTFLQIIDKNY